MTSWLRWILRAAAAVIVVVLLSALPYYGLNKSGSGKLERMQQELDKTQSEIGQTSTDVLQRRRRVDALKNDTSTIEAIARQELQMLYPHEKTLRLSDVGSHGPASLEPSAEVVH